MKLQSVVRRPLWSGLVVLLLGALGGWVYLSRGASEARDRNSVWYSSLYDKSVAIEGLSMLSPGEIEAHLPLARSVVWWHLFPGDIEQAVLKHPLVASVAIESSLLRPQQFVVKVQERQPRFVVPVHDEVWLVADDGVFLREVTSGESRNEIKVPQRLILVSGDTTRSSSPDLLRSRLRYLAEVAEVIESEAGRRIEEIALRGSDELSVHFSETGFQAVFSQVEGDFSSLAREARRFAVLRERLAAQGTPVESIDLSYPNNAVVTVVKDGAGSTSTKKDGEAKARRPIGRGE